MKKTFQKVLLTATVLCLAVSCFSEDMEKNAREEISKALKAKLISVSDISRYYEKINKGKAEEVIKELKKLAAQEGQVSDKNPAGWRLDGTGKFPGAEPPLSWSLDRNGNKKNIAWVSEMPFYCPGSVLAAGDKLFTGSNDYSLVCLDKKTGKILWLRSVSPYDAAEKEERDGNKEVFVALDALAKQRNELNSKIPGLPPGEIFKSGVEVNKIEKEMEKILCESDKEKYKNTGMTYSDGGFMSTTPASDGTFIYAWNAWGVTACFDLNGERKWIRFDKLKPQEHGHYGSPLLIGDKLIIHTGKQYKALDKKTGKEIWTSEVVLTNPGWSGYWYGSHLYARIGNEDIIISGNRALFKASDGKQFMKGMGMQCPSPVFGDGYVSWINGPGSAAPYFYKMPSTTLGTEIPVIKTCSFKRAKEIKSQGSYFSASALILNGLLYSIGCDPVLYVYDLTADRLVYQQVLDFGPTPDRLDRPYGCGIGASPTLAGGKIFLWGNFGTTLIIEPGTVYKVLGKNTIDTRLTYNYKNDQQEGTVSNPWFEGKRIYYRAQKYIYCIEEKK